LQRLRRGDLDAAILALPYDCEGLLTFDFLQEELLWITHSEDKLARLKTISVKELEQTNLMLLKDGHCLTDHALAACQLEASSAHSFSATSLATLIQLVTAGMGSTLVPEIALAQLVTDNPAIKAVPLSEPGPHRRLAFAIRPNYPGIANIEALITLFREELLPVLSKKRR
jgi:LysR family hydrogen peroxide-inducible transcriptional activator